MAAGTRRLGRRWSWAGAWLTRLRARGQHGGESSNAPRARRRTTKERGASGSASSSPGASERGLLVQPRVDLGRAVERLWSVRDTRGLAPDGESSPERRLEAEFGYGPAARGDSGSEVYLDASRCPRIPSASNSVSGSEMGCRDGPKRRARSGARHRAVRPDARVTPGPKCGGHPTPHCASPARAGGRLRPDQSRRARGARPPARGLRSLARRENRRQVPDRALRAPDRARGAEATSAFGPDRMRRRRLDDCVGSTAALAGHQHQW